MCGVWGWKYQKIEQEVEQIEQEVKKLSRNENFEKIFLPNFSTTLGHRVLIVLCNNGQLKINIEVYGSLLNFS